MLANVHPALSYTLDTWPLVFTEWLSEVWSQQRKWLVWGTEGGPDCLANINIVQAEPEWVRRKNSAKHDGHLQQSNNSGCGDLFRR